MFPSHRLVRLIIKNDSESDTIQLMSVSIPSSGSIDRQRKASRYYCGRCSVSIPSSGSINRQAALADQVNAQRQSFNSNPGSINRQAVIQHITSEGYRIVSIPILVRLIIKQKSGLWLMARIAEFQFQSWFD